MAKAYLLCRRKSADSKLITRLMHSDFTSKPEHSMHSPATLVYPSLQLEPASHTHHTMSLVESNLNTLVAYDPLLQLLLIDAGAGITHT